MEQVFTDAFEPFQSNRKSPSHWTSPEFRANPVFATSRAAEKIFARLRKDPFS